MRELVEVVRHLDATVRSMTPAALEDDIQVAVRSAVGKAMDDRVRHIAGLLEAQFRALEERSLSEVPLMTPAALEHAIQAAVSSTLRKLTDDRERQFAGLMERQSRFQHELTQTNEMLARNRELLEALLGKLVDAPSQLASEPAPQAHLPRVARPGTQQAAPQPASQHSSAVESRWQARVAQGEALRAEWVRDKLLVPAAELAKLWGRTRQALDQACERGELFSLKVGKNRYYPAAFLNLDAEAVKRVNLALKGDDVTAKFLFWQETFGALGGKSITEALAAGKVDRAEELALGWSEEHGFVNASAA